MAIPLEASDEPYRFPIQLYHRTATQADLGGKRVLEVGCGHGGGASYLMRTLHPASYTGLDLNPVGIAFCRERHNVPGLDFVQGDAENLPFPDQSFDAVINIESSHCYPRFPRFLVSATGRRSWPAPRYRCVRTRTSRCRCCAVYAGWRARWRASWKEIGPRRACLQTSATWPVRPPLGEARSYTAQCKGISRTECTVSPRTEARPVLRDRLTVVTTSTLPP
jgi:SAM-dependent methyltransferase